MLSLTLFGVLSGAVSSYESAAENSIPTYLQHWPGLYIRIGNTIEDAPEEDVTVALRYPLYEDKGKLIDGQRITIMISTDTAAVGDEIRIIHVMEAPEPGTHRIQWILYPWESNVLTVEVRGE